jgi:arylformamidase
VTSTNVYRQYDQAGLDDEYNNRKRWPDFSDHFARWSELSEKTRASLPNTLDIAYGEDPIERLDVFPSEETGTPLYVFIHGGYWYSLDKENYSYVADAMRPHGITTAVLNYGLAPDYDMDTIVGQIRSALAWLYRNAEAMGADPDRIYVTGHSAGGHLATMLLATDWATMGVDLPQDLVKGVCAIGGIFDLEPIQLSFVNKTLHMDPEEAVRNSPIHQTYPASAPLSLIVAVDESAEYHRQSESMKELWSDLGYPVELIVPEGYDHFSVANDLGNPACSLVTHQLDQMRIAFNDRAVPAPAGQ